MKSYHNTNGLTGEALKSSENKAMNQEQVIHQIFKENNKMTASEVWLKIPNICPLTSVRRAMSNLCSFDILEITKEMNIGLFGKPEHFYRLK